MHASISRSAGDPDDMLARYDALLGEVPAALPDPVVEDHPVHAAITAGERVLA